LKKVQFLNKSNKNFFLNIVESERNNGVQIIFNKRIKRKITGRYRLVNGHLSIINISLKTTELMIAGIYMPSNMSNASIFKIIFFI
jgi:hypothetical protein